MGLVNYTFNTKEEMAEWLIRNIKDKFDQQELMFEGLSHFKEKGTYSIRPRIICIKLETKVIDENGNELFLEDCSNHEMYYWYTEKVIKYNYNPKHYCSQQMSLWRWLKLQTTPCPELDGEPSDLLF
jgi:hypothetical protein